MKHSLLVSLMLSFLVAVTLPIAAHAASTFSDTKGHWAEKDIQTAVERGYVSGYPGGTFKPNGTITRAEAAGMLSRITKQTPATTSQAFSDLDHHWANDQVRKLVALGFIDPADYRNGFGPDKPITRFELMKWISSGLAKSDPSFQQALADTKNTFLPTPESFKGTIKATQIPYIAVVKGTGIIEGFEDLTFRPESNTTRAEVVSTLLRYEKMEGTKAGDYSDLNELREIGTTGTNMLSATKLKYVKSSKSIFGKKFTLKSSDLVIHRMIFVDTTGNETKGLFGPLFVGEYRTESNNGRYLVFFESDLTYKADKFEFLSFVNEFSKAGNLFRPVTINPDVVKKIGVPVIPRDNTEEFLLTHKTRHIWSYSSLDPSLAGWHLTADTGEMLGIYPS